MKAALSLDLDNQWSYMKTHGDPAWQTMPSYLNLLVPRILEILDQLNLRITFFIVGQDAAMPMHADILAEIARRGHEIGNHSHHHEPWMHRRSAAAIDDELARAEASIENVTGHRPRGFRGPGFTRSTTILETLVRRGYAYDASSLPTFIGPLARAYYFRSSKLGPEAMREREDLFGSFSDGLRPNRRHAIALSNGSIVEIPVTTFPLLRVPDPHQLRHLPCDGLAVRSARLLSCGFARVQALAHGAFDPPPSTRLSARKRMPRIGILSGNEPGLER